MIYLCDFKTVVPGTLNYYVMSKDNLEKLAVSVKCDSLVSLLQTNKQKEVLNILLDTFENKGKYTKNWYKEEYYNLYFVIDKSYDCSEFLTWLKAELGYEVVGLQFDATEACAAYTFLQLGIAIRAYTMGCKNVELVKTGEAGNEDVSCTFDNSFSSRDYCKVYMTGYQFVKKDTDVPLELLNDVFSETNAFMMSILVMGENFEESFRELRKQAEYFVDQYKEEYSVLLDKLIKKDSLNTDDFKEVLGDNRKLTILLVEDNQDKMATLKETLHSIDGISVNTVASGNEAMQLLFRKEHCYNAVFLDRGLPIYSDGNSFDDYDSQAGLAILEEMNSLKNKIKPIPVVICSADEQRVDSDFVVDTIKYDSSVWMYPKCIKAIKEIRKSELLRG